MTKKALIIGFNYRGTRCPLQGCWNDVRNIYNFLSSRGYSKTNIQTLIDINEIHGKDKVIERMIDFMEKVEPGDQVFFHFSGHGGQLPDEGGEIDEKDGFDECIYADDLEPIRDDDLNQILIGCLPEGATLIAILDCCHSGSGLDLRYIYSKYGPKEENKKEVNRKVICISACEDYDTAADTSYVTNGKRIPQGALTHNFIEAIEKYHSQKWYEIVNQITINTKGYHQIAQLSTSAKDGSQWPVEI